MLDFASRNHVDPKGGSRRKPLKWILADSAIIGLIAMCASMPSAVPDVNSLWVMFKAFLGAFAAQLAVERGLRRK